MRSRETIMHTTSVLCFLVWPNRLIGCDDRGLVTLLPGSIKPWIGKELQPHTYYGERGRRLSVTNRTFSSLNHKDSGELGGANDQLVPVWCYILIKSKNGL